MIWDRLIKSCFLLVFVLEFSQALKCWCTICEEDSNNTCTTDGLCFTEALHDHDHNETRYEYGCLNQNQFLPSNELPFLCQDNRFGVGCCFEPYCNRDLLPVTYGPGGPERILFRNPHHDPRVHEGAPPGLHVSTVEAYYPFCTDCKSVLYNLLGIVHDHSYFAMESASGNISTARKIDRKVGDTYEFIAAAISQGETKQSQMTITVTEFNVHPPEFEHDVYRGELHVRSKVGTAVLKVRALDKDTIPYNAEVYYKLEDNPEGRFTLGLRSGVLTLVRSLEKGTYEPVFHLGVTAVDGGSPERSDHAKIEILIKTISEPRDVRPANATGSTVQVCWARPEFGQVLGYIVKYREVENPHGQSVYLNITSDAALECSTLVELKPWTDYEYRVYGWNRFETGQGSTVGRFGTLPETVVSSDVELPTEYLKNIENLNKLTKTEKDAENFEPDRGGIIPKLPAPNVVSQATRGGQQFFSEVFLMVIILGRFNYLFFRL